MYILWGSAENFRNRSACWMNTHMDRDVCIHIKDMEYGNNFIRDQYHEKVIRNVKITDGYFLEHQQNRISFYDLNLQKGLERHQRDRLMDTKCVCV